MCSPWRKGQSIFTFKTSLFSSVSDRIIKDSKMDDKLKLEFGSH